MTAHEGIANWLANSAVKPIMASMVKVAVTFIDRWIALFSCQSIIGGESFG